MTATPESLGACIRQARESKGLSQREAAARLGVSFSAYGMWERGEHTPDALTFMKLADLLGIDRTYCAIAQGEAQHLGFSPTLAVIAGEIWCPLVGKSAPVHGCATCLHYRGVNLVHGHGAKPAFAVLCVAPGPEEAA